MPTDPKQFWTIQEWIDEATAELQAENKELRELLRECFWWARKAILNWQGSGYGPHGEIELEKRIKEVLDG